MDPKTHTRPTHTVASAYVEDLFAGDDWEGMDNLVITGCADFEDDCVDVTFEYGDVMLNTGTMTVWYQPSGKLYGEW